MVAVVEDTPLIGDSLQALPAATPIATATEMICTRTDVFPRHPFRVVLLRPAELFIYSRDCVKSPEEPAVSMTYTSLMSRVFGVVSW